MIFERAEYPEGIKPGDFIQTDKHFGDIFFEVKSCWNSDGHWSITYITYDKYGGTPRTEWVNSATRIRRVIPAEMAVPTIVARRNRFKASFGQYDPFYGFAPVGTPLRNKEQW